jgi:hypothetical protein
MKKNNKIILLTIFIILFTSISVKASAPTLSVPNVNISVDGAQTPKEYVDRKEKIAQASIKELENEIKRRNKKAS